MESMNAGRALEFVRSLIELAEASATANDFEWLKGFAEQLEELCDAAKGAAERIAPNDKSSG